MLIQKFYAEKLEHKLQKAFELIPDCPSAWDVEHLTIKTGLVWSFLTVTSARKCSVGRSSWVLLSHPSPFILLERPELHIVHWKRKYTRGCAAQCQHSWVSTWACRVPGVFCWFHARWFSIQYQAGCDEDSLTHPFFCLSICRLTANLCWKCFA